MATTTDLASYLNDNNVKFRIRLHLPTYTAHALAAANHVHVSAVAQTVVVQAEGKYWMTVFPGDMQLNATALARVLESEHVHEASAWDLQGLFPDCDIDSLPPFGNLYGLDVIADPSLEQAGTIVFHACSRTSSVTVEWSAFKRLVRPVLAHIAEPVHSLENQER